MADEGHGQPTDASNTGKTRRTGDAGDPRGDDDTNVTSTGQTYEDVGTMGGQYMEHVDQGTYRDPRTGEWREHFDYPTAGGVHHHEERMGPSGVYREKDVYMGEDGSRYVRKVFIDENTGMMQERRYKVDHHHQGRRSSG